MVFVICYNVLSIAYNLYIRLTSLDLSTHFPSERSDKCYPIFIKVLKKNTEIIEGFLICRKLYMALMKLWHLFYNQKIAKIFF